MFQKFGDVVKVLLCDVVLYVGSLVSDKIWQRKERILPVGLYFMFA